MPKQQFERLFKLMESHKLDAVALNPSPSLTYLTGLQFHLMERPVVFIIAPPEDPVLILPVLEKSKAEAVQGEFRCISYEDDPDVWQNAFNIAAKELKLNQCTIGIEPNHMRMLEYHFLEQAAPQALYKSGESVFNDLRMQKNTAEINTIRKAVDIAQNALQQVILQIKPGITEREIASELTIQMLRAGADSEMPFPPIVSSGANTSDPHAVPTGRVVKAGDLLLIDWGAFYQGYLSDITRTFAIQKVDPELKKIAQIVIEANTAGRLAAGVPGCSAADVDTATRNVITQAGYGSYFTHRTGHGFGLEAHEPPFIHGKNPLTLLPGMTFTIEPGIYIPNFGGVRFEDDVVITENGAEALSSLPRELLEIG